MQKSQILSSILIKNSIVSNLIQRKQSDLSQKTQFSQVLSEKNKFQIESQKRISLQNFKTKRSQIRKRLSLSIPFEEKLVNSINKINTACSLKQENQKSENSSVKISSEIFLQDFLKNQCEDNCFTLKNNMQNFYSKYNILTKIGEGIHSSVYKCLHIKTEKLFAVKISKNVDQQLKKQMIKQYKLLKIMDHQNVLKVYELIYHEKEEKMFVVCELCEYQDLKQQMIKRRSQNQSFSQEQILDLIKKIIKTVKYLHKSGVCHRDIKPQNILYNPLTKEIKIIDFDISKEKFMVKDEFLMWTNTGTLHYRAPQTFSFGYGQKSDVWSTGVILYQIVFGKLPFISEYEPETIQKIKTQKIDFQSKKCNKKLKVLLTKMLQKEAKNRYSCKQILQFIKQKKFMSKDDSILYHRKKLQNKNSFKSQIPEKNYYLSQQESCLSYNIKIDYHKWNITICKC